MHGLGTALFQRVSELDLEGIVARHSSGPYVTDCESSTGSRFSIENIRKWRDRGGDGKSYSNVSATTSQFQAGTPAYWHARGWNEARPLREPLESERYTGCVISHIEQQMFWAIRMLSNMTTGKFRHGVECTICHTVYFIGHASNRDRLYYASPCGSKSKGLDSRTPIYEISDFANRYLHRPFGAPAKRVLSCILPNLWKLLCICGQEIPFVKAELKWYAASQEAFGRGHAIQGEWKEVRKGEWKEVSEVIAYLQNHTFDNLRTA